MGEGSVMKNVRVWYRKDGACRYISHLDINRTVTRAMQMSGIPLWHTEGFNSRMYVSFALPLSLGFRGLYECVDIRLLDDDYPFELIINNLNACLPAGLEVYEVSEPVMKPSGIAYADFDISIASENIPMNELLNKTQQLLESQNIFVEKKTKKGAVKTVDLKENIARYGISVNDNAVSLKITLPAGSEKNVNPQLLTDVLEKNCGCEIFADITRTKLLTKDFELFV